MQSNRAALHEPVVAHLMLLRPVWVKLVHVDDIRNKEVLLSYELLFSMSLHVCACLTRLVFFCCRLVFATRVFYS